jgi:hypothetical protein
MNPPMHTRRPALFRSILVAAAALALTTRCIEEDQLSGESQVKDCLSPKEVKKRCNKEFNACLNSPIQNIPSDTSGHSLCWPCKDVCMQNNGVWPDRLWDGRLCRW